MRFVPYLAHLSGPLFLLAFAMQSTLILPFERFLVGDIANTASLFYLPAGVKLVAFYVFRWKSLPSLTLGLVLAFGWFYLPEGTPLSIWLVAGVGSALALPLTYWALCRFLKLDLFNHRQGAPHWSALILIVGLSSVANGYAISTVWNFDAELLWLMRITIGDVMGALGCLIVAMLVLRRQRLTRASADAP